MFPSRFILLAAVVATLSVLCSTFPRADAACLGDVPAITSPADPFAFAPITSTATAAYDFYISSSITTNQGMQSMFATKILSGEKLSLSQYFWWSGTLGIHDKLVAYLPGGSTSICDWTVRPMFKQARYGIDKRALHDDAITTAFSPDVVDSNLTAFDFVLRGDDSQDFNDIITTRGYSYELRFSPNRVCNFTTDDLFLGSSPAIVNTTAIKWSVGATLNTGVYSVCLRINDTDGVTTSWFPMAAANGHYRHNLVVGDITTGPSLYISHNSHPTLSPHPRYSDSGQSAVLFIESAVDNTPFQYFTIDTSLDRCNPLENEHFDSSEIAFWNGSYKVASSAILVPPQDHGGGYGYLCGSRTATEPWMQISYNPIYVRRCQSQPTKQYWLDGSCFTCACNNAGTCNTDETIDFTAKSKSCTCNTGHYGTSCEYADIDPPVASLANLSIVRRAITVSFTAPDAAWDVYMKWMGNSTTVSCTSVCYAHLPQLPRHAAIISFAIELWSRASNGSETQQPRRPTYIYYVGPPTLSGSLTQSQSVTNSKSTSQSNSSTHSRTVTPPPTATKTSTRTRTIPPTITHELTATRSRQTMNETICAAALNETPATFYSPNTNLSYQINASMRCGECSALQCSWGFDASCRGPDAFAIDLSYISSYATPYCNVSFYDSVSNGLINISLPITIVPTPITQSHFWLPQVGFFVKDANGTTQLLRSADALSVALLNYAAAPPRIPYSYANTSLRIRVCSNDTALGNLSEASWSDLKIIDASSTLDASVLTRLALAAGAASDKVCVEVEVSSPPMQTTRFTFTLILDGAQAAGGGGFVKGHAAPKLALVSKGEYLPPTDVPEAPTLAAMSVEIASAYGDAQGGDVSNEGIKDVSDFNAATFAIVAVTLLVGGVVAYVVYQRFKPTQRDNVAGVVNAMMSPLEKKQAMMQ